MNLKKIFASLVIIPALLVCGCNKDDDGGDDESEKVLEYSTVSQEETVAFLSQALEGEAFNINGYSFKMKMSYPLDIFGDWGEAEEDAMWPDTSDSTKWESVLMDGVVTNNDGDFEAKFTTTGADVNADVYVKDNTFYMDDGENKYKVTFDSYSDMEMAGLFDELPDISGLLEQIEVVCAAEEGLTFEKGTLDGKDYYHISGLVAIGESGEGFSADIDMPIDLYLTFENGQLVSYKYKTMLFIMLIECEVDAFAGEIEFPQNLEDYEENMDALM